MTTGTSGTQALFEAIKNGDADAIRAVLAADPSAARTRAGSGESPVLLAVYHGRRDLLPLLLPHVLLDSHEAAAVGDVERLNAVVRGDAAVLQTRSGDGWTPLHLAAFFADADVVGALLSHGADVHALSTNHTANTPLHAAIAGRGDAASIRRLIEAGADVNSRAGGGWTPLHLAASRGDTALVDYLLARGADATATSDEGRSAVEIAEERGHPETAARLRAAVSGSTA